MKLEVKAKKIKDSRGEDTIEVSVNGCSASSPSGKSKGKYETPSYLNNLEYNINALNNLKLKLEVNSFSDLKKIEDTLKYLFDLKDAKQFGANALFAFESAILKALAKSQKKQLWQIINPNAKSFPTPIGNSIGGGLHSHNKSPPIFQEFLLIPKGNSFKEKVKRMKLVYEELGKILGSKEKNDEGAWQADKTEEEILEILSTFSGECSFGIDIAASSFFNDNNYIYRELKLNKEEQIKYINLLSKKYGSIYLEDPIEENDFESFSKINKRERLIVGDDLTATNLGRLEKAIKTNSINAIIIKPNQNGSLLELKKIFSFCKKKKIKTILSHRSGETLDNALADYAFGFQADFIKCGISTKWREAKLNRLIEIENSLKN